VLGRLNSKVLKMLLSDHVLLQINNPEILERLLLHREVCDLGKCGLDAERYRYGCAIGSLL